MTPGPEHFERVSEIISITLDGADKRRGWVVVLGLTPKLDGDQWCFLWGEDLAIGVAGFGASPVAAMADFDRAMYAALSSASPPTNGAGKDR